jgi:hypothetical protein
VPEYNLPEEYYQQHGFTRLRAGSGPHLGADANLSFDIVEKSEITASQPAVSNGQLKCYQRTKTTKYLFTWRLNPATRKFTLESEKVLEVVYGPLVEVPCPKALTDQFGSAPPLIDEDRYEQCPEGDPFETAGKQPDDFYNEFFAGSTVRVAQRTGTTKGNVDLLEIDGFVYARTDMESGTRCFRRSRHIKARLYWTLCPRTGWHLHTRDYYVNLWGPWEEIPCGQIPKDTVVLSAVSDG